MLKFETHNIEPALAELGEAASRYFHDRLLAPEKRADVMVTLRLISDQNSSTNNSPSGLQREYMLATKQRGKLKPPSDFDVLINRQDDVLDTMLKLAHEWIHIAQVAAGRFMLHGQPSKADKYIAEWLGQKIGPIDLIPYNLRPWELEAHEWQHKLVTEFVDRYAKDEAE